MRLLPSVLLVVAGICAVTGAALANVLDVPITEEAGDGQMANCTSSVVTGLPPDGDGFLASGPVRAATTARSTSSGTAMS